MNPSTLIAGVAGRKESVMDFTSIQAGLLPTGTVTGLGTIEACSMTAYLIDGAWIPFHRIHGRPAIARPLVTLDGSWWS